MDFVKRLQIIDRSWLKIIAVIAMLQGHIANYFLIHNPVFTSTLVTIGGVDVTTYYLMRTFGRCAFAIFGFQIVEGFIHTHSRYKYGRNLLLFALISEIPWNLAHSGTVFYYRQNVIFTLFWGFLGLCALEFLRGKQRWAAVIAILTTAYFFRANREHMGVLYIWALYGLRHNTLLRSVVGFGLLPQKWTFGQALAFIPICLYNGKRGFIKGNFAKYLFYAFYPGHLLLIYFIKYWWMVQG